jgi:serine/threonine-protein kinase
MRDGIPDFGDVLAEKYLIEQVIGQGGMGTVFAGVHLLTEKRLAIKCLLPQHARDEGSVARFMREARAAGRIQHRHVIDVFDVGNSQGVPFIVMPRLEGKSLTELLRDETLTLDQVLVIMLRAMDGVHAAHRVGIIHRDLKPCNIFVCQGVSGRLDDPQVLDFGISKDTDESDRRLTRSGTVVGTPYYMALEQLTGKRDIDHRVDIYSIGVILYEALTGKPPHHAENAAALAIQIMHVAPRHLATLRPDLPAGLADVVMRSLARDREDRFADMAAFVAALSPYASSGNALASEPQGPRLRTPRDSARAEGGRMSKTTVPNETHPQQQSIVGTQAQVSKPPSTLSRKRKTRLFVSGAAVTLVAGLVLWGVERAGPQTRREPVLKTNTIVPGSSDQPLSTEGALPAQQPLATALQHDETAADASAQPQHGPTPSTPPRIAPHGGKRKHPQSAPGAPVADAAAPPAAATPPPTPAPSRPRANELSPEQF